MMQSRIRTLAIRKLRATHLVIHFAMAVLLASVAVAEESAETAQGQFPAMQAENSNNRAAAQMLIDATRTGESLIENLDTIMESPPGGARTFDNEMLAEECERRFAFREIWSISIKGTSIGILPDARIQVLCWVAECNKRMLFDQPDVRARQRERILMRVKELLEKAASPEETRGLLDAAYRTAFYSSLVWPDRGADAADAIIDLYKQYVPGTDPIVHDFACSRLRRLGYMRFDRRSELLEFLLQEAPELRPELAAQRPPIHYDTFLGSDLDTIIGEREYLSVLKASPQELAALAESRLKGGDAALTEVGYMAVRKLVQDACGANGGAASEQVADLLRKGVYIDNTFYMVAERAAQAQSPEDQQAAKLCLDRVLKAIEDIPESDWPRSSSVTREKLLENAGKELDRKNVDNPDSVSYLHVKESLGDAAERLAAKKAEAATNR